MSEIRVSLGQNLNVDNDGVTIDKVLKYVDTNIKIGDNTTSQYIDNDSNIALGRFAGRGRNNSISSGGYAFTITSSTSIGGFATFTNIYPSGGSGTGAVLKVNRGSSGEVTFIFTDTNDLSEGYQIGDILTINGSDVGGVTGVDDITVTIASVDASQSNVEENIFIGSYAGRNIGSGSDNNIFIGQCAGFYSTYAIRNVYIGQNAGLPNTQGIENIAIGYGAGNNWPSNDYSQGNGNTFLGYYAGSTYDGFGNTAIGYRTAERNTTGDYNAFLGSGSGQSNTSGSCNSFTGNYSGAANTTGYLNTANGYLAGGRNNIGSDNTFLGAGAGYNNTSGNNNIFIGSYSGTSTGVCNVTTQSNYIVMGNNAHTCALIQVGWTTVSDIRDKCIYGNVQHGRGFLQNITPIEYAFKDRETGCLTDPEGKRRYGFSAQNILEAEGTDNPVIVSNDNPEKLQITSDYLIPVLVNAVNELSAEIDNLRSEINLLKSSA